MFNNSIWGLDRNSSGVFEVSDEKELRLKMFVNNSKKENAFSKAVCADGKMIFVPFNSSDLCIYDIEHDSFKNLSIVDTDCKEAFMNAFVMGERVFLIPFSYSSIVCVDLKNLKKREVPLPRKILERKKERFFIKFEALSDKLILPVFATNLLLSFSLENESFEIIELQNPKFEINSICRNSDYYFLLSRNSLEVLVLSKDLSEVKEIRMEERLFPLGEKVTYFDQSGFEVFENKLFCFPSRWEHVVCIDLDTFVPRIVSQADTLTDSTNRKNSSCFNNGLAIGSKLFIQHVDSQIVIFDMKKETFKCISERNNDADSVYLKAFCKSLLV